MPFTYGFNNSEAWNTNINAAATAKIVRKEVATATEPIVAVAADGSNRNYASWTEYHYYLQNLINLAANLLSPASDVTTVHNPADPNASGFN